MYGFLYYICILCALITLILYYSFILKKCGINEIYNYVFITYIYHLLPK